MIISPLPPAEAGTRLATPEGCKAELACARLRGHPPYFPPQRRLGSRRLDSQPVCLVQLLDSNCVHVRLHPSEVGAWRGYVLTRICLFVLRNFALSEIKSQKNRLLWLIFNFLAPDFVIAALFVFSAVKFCKHLHAPEGRHNYKLIRMKFSM